MMTDRPQVISLKHVRRFELTVSQFLALFVLQLFVA